MNDRVVLVTGGAGHLGRSVTRTFLEGGARVVVPMYKGDADGVLDELRGRYPGRLHTFSLDLTTERGAAQAVGQVVEWGGRIDAVAHLIGGYIGGQEIADTATDVWEHMIDLNLTSAWLVARSALPPMVGQGGGSLVFVSSRSALRQRARNGAYAVSKAALITLAEAIAEEYGGRGVRANVVVPGTIDTEANRRAMPDADPAGWTPPGQVARVIAYLSSSAADGMNGKVVEVGGGTPP